MRSKSILCSSSSISRLAAIASRVHVASKAPASNGDDGSESSWEGESAYTHDGERAISVIWGKQIKRFSIDAPYKTLRDAIRSAFGLQAGQEFWLEDENELVHALDRDMPQITYTLCVYKGMIINVCFSLDRFHVCQFFEKQICEQGDLSDLLHRCGWVGLQGCWVDGRVVDRIEFLNTEELYHGITSPPRGGGAGDDHPLLAQLRKSFSEEEDK